MPLVRLTVVADDIRAEVLCGRLRSSGIDCAHRKTDRGAAISTYSGGWAIAGPTEVVVDESDLGDAQRLLQQDWASPGPVRRNA